MFDSLNIANSNIDLDKLIYKSNGTIYAFELFTGITNQISAGGNELQDVLLFLYNRLNPDVGTSAVEKENGSKNLVVIQNTTIVDTVRYADLIIVKHILL
ncbi:hypothetical protein ALNOE001_06240 [Candidatus Methanobinarius endosymbioticus]|uniref:Uncharacterized protein n=1 Tax=Candidatus Methanobinarius endosymbioticus TaxID=2006182 RepID=A0A366MCB7_9EURY|nr:hypothetical protein ALNOE001_06240 [Candidatus Methanobinarius endosymbioticus]